MSYTQQAILRDKNGDAIPQIWDVTQNKFVPYTNNDIKLLQNELILVKSELETIKTNQLSGDQKVQLSGTLTELEQARELLDAISGKDFATQTTLAAVLAKLADLESELATIKANQLSGDQKVTLSGINTELEALMQGFATEDKLEQVRQLLTGVATENKLEQARTLLEAISTKDFATQTTLTAVLAKLEQLETEIQAVKANQVSGDQKVTLSGNDVVIGLLADRPPASEMRGRGYYAWDETDGHKLKYSDGTNWVVNQ